MRYSAADFWLVHVTYRKQKRHDCAKASYYFSRSGEKLFCSCQADDGSSSPAAPRYRIPTRKHPAGRRYIIHHNSSWQCPSSASLHGAYFDISSSSIWTEACDCWLAFGFQKRKIHVFMCKLVMWTCKCVFITRKAMAVSGMSELGRRVITRQKHVETQRKGKIMRSAPTEAIGLTVWRLERNFRHQLRIAMSAGIRGCRKWKYSPVVSNCW